VLADLASPCELFGGVRTRNGARAYEVRVCSAVQAVRTQYLTLTVRSRLRWLETADTVIIPGLDDLDRSLPPGLLSALRRAIATGARIASICTGAFILARTGILDGRRATTHWAVAGELARRHPKVTVDPNVLYVDAGRVLTSAGAAAGLDLCLHLIRQDFGDAVAADAARSAVMPLERSGGQAQFIRVAPPSPASGSLGALLTWAAEHLREELGLVVLARRAAMSPRTLSRHFRAQVGTTPARWVATARVRHSQRLLETTTLSVEEIAGAVGFQSSVVLREQFRRLVGTSPLLYRSAFAQKRG
jgi:transcriptional regulator GlxA family with amidase domain